MTHERRRSGRTRLPFPLKIRGWDPDGSPWEEATQTEDVSSGGIGFFLRHSVALGQVLYLSLPLPRNLRQYDLDAPTYLVYSVIRYVGGPKVGVMFLGKFPPKGFQQEPGRRNFPTESQQARQVQRYEVSASVRLRRLEAPSGEAAEEVTKTENVSQTGVMLVTSLPIRNGETIEIEEMGSGGFRSWGKVQAVSTGAEGRPRLGVIFLEADAAVRSTAWLQRIGVSLESADGPRPLQFERALLEPCREGQHAVCPAGRAAGSERKFRLCTCSCHEPARS